MRVILREATDKKIKSSQDTYEIMQKIFFGRSRRMDIKKEHFWVFALDNANRILNIELVSIGSHRRTTCDVADILSIPLQKSATQIILVHNHPSGNLEPSHADFDVTNKVLHGAILVDINVVDHLVITKHSYYSFADNGHIDTLMFDNKYALTLTQEKFLKQKMEALKKQVAKEKKKERREGEKVGLERGRKEGEEIGEKKKGKEVAVRMLRKGMDLAVIKELTGITLQQLGRLRNELGRSRQ